MIKDYLKIFLFLSSYAPLFLILAIKDYAYTYFVIAMGILIFVPTSVLIYTIKKSHGMSGEYHEIKEVEDKSNQFLEYIIAYIIPFLGFNLTNLSDLISLSILFVIIGFLYIKSDMIYMNPVLKLLNYNLYKIKDGKKTSIIISKEDIQINTKIRIYMISKTLGIAK